MRLMNSEMRKNMSSFDYGERSLKKYGVQLDGLNKKLELQKTVTESARQHYEKMVEEHGEGSRQAQNAAAAYNNEAAQLNNLERHIQGVTKEMEAFKREQQIQSTTLWRAGDALEGFGTGLGKVSEKIKGVGSDLTNKITKPAFFAGSAVAGLVGALGFKRLVGMDNAQAKLRGLGYEGKAVDNIMKDVEGAVQGTTHTMAEGADTAAGALAAGVKEGAELERYIKLVGDAATGSNRPMGEMSQIFNRVQGSGKLMTQELNMIEHGLPGFAQAMADELADGSLEAFRQMVTNGEVGSAEFLDVMEDFAGGMSAAYSETWEGITKNILSNIGIIGESLLEGLFKDGKKSLAEFLEVLRESEGLKSWATETGEKIRELAGTIVNGVKTVIGWFNNLSDSGKKVILGIGAFALAIGPLLVGLGTVGGIIAKVSSGLGSLLKFLAPITKGFGLFGGAAGKAGGAAGSVGRSVGLLSRVFGFLTGPVGIAVSAITLLVTGFITAYKNSETFREFIQKLGEKIKEIFKGIVEWIKPGFEAVKDFFGEMQKKFQEFMNNEGPQLREAFENIKEVLSIVGEFIAEKVVAEFEKLKNFIEFVMPFIEAVIKNVWDSIKTIIKGAFDVIMGAVKVFSGLFTGDFSKMWEGVKDIFSGAIDIVWGFIKVSFIGQIIKAIIDFVKRFVGRITDMWESVKSKFGEKIKEIFNNLKNSFIGRIITNIIDFASNFRENISSMWTKVQALFRKFIDRIRHSIENSFVGRMLKSVRNLKTRFVDIAKEMWEGVKKWFGKIVEGANELPGKIGKGISGAKDKATDGMKAVGNKLIEWAGKPFNKVVDGVNWVTGKLMPDRDPIGHWDYPQYAKGTKGSGHPGGLAVIGEKGRELVQLPDGRSFISPGGDTLIDLPKGTHVVPNPMTEKILKSDLAHYAKGTKGWFSNFKSSVGEVWDYMSNPSKIIKKLIDNISIKKGMAEIPKEIVGSAWEYVKTKPIEYIKSMFEKAEKEGHGGGGKPAFGWPVTSPFGYRIHPITGARKLHGGVDFGAPMGSPVPSTTGGTVSFASGGWNGGFGNLVKVRQGMWEMFYAHLSKILVRAGQSVKKGDILGLVGSTGASTGPHLHYETRKNGVRVNPMALKGFKTGGVIKSRMMAMLGEDGEEIVIPTARNRRTDAMKLLALAAKKIGADGGSFARPSNMPNAKEDNTLNDLLNATLQQNQILMKLLKKDNKVYIDGDDITNRVNDNNALKDILTYF